MKKLSVALVLIITVKLVVVASAGCTDRGLAPNECVSPLSGILGPQITEERPTTEELEKAQEAVREELGGPIDPEKLDGYECEEERRRR